MGIVVGGERAWRTFRKGDIAVALHWVDGEPAMILFPAAAPQGRCRGVVPFVVPLAVLHEYVRADGHPQVRRALQGARAAARCLGMAPELSVLHRIIDAIVEAAPELVAMPPEPSSWEQERAAAGPVLGELSIVGDGRVLLERELRAGEVNDGRGLGDVG
jgi:hypothetical protein